MLHGGAATLADVREPTNEIACDACGRRGCYRVERLAARSTRHEADRSPCNAGRLPQGTFCSPSRTKSM
jgi:hypothetical protein